MRSDTAVLEKEKTITIDDESWNVILHNNDQTPMDFVVFVLATIFKKSIEESIQITLNIHNNGQSVVETYSSYEVAEQKVEEVHNIAQNNGWPLKASVSK